jgi:hypothetical protein
VAAGAEPERTGSDRLAALLAAGEPLVEIG